MTTKKDEPGKDPLRPSEAAGGKKPVPTIDLKATEVTGAKSEQSAPAEGKGASEKSASGQTTPAAIAGAAPGAKASSDAPAAKTGIGSSTASAGTASGATAGASTPPAAGKAPDTKSPDAKSSDATSSGGRGSDGKGAKSDKVGSNPADTAAAKTRRGGGFLSHLTAGVVGGFLALLGADMLGPQIPPIADSLGLPSASQQTTESAAEIERRLTALEQSAKEDTANGDVAARLEAADSRIAALEELRQSVGELQKTQADLTQKAATLDQQLQAAPQGTASDDRIAKLEQQLDTLAAAAGEGGTSALPELAALTGRLADVEAAVNNQIGALRESVNKDVDARIAKIAETSESARAATQRMDRELASVTTEVARLGQRFEALKADDSRISESLRAVQEEAGALRSQLEAFSGDVTQKVAKLTTAEDVSSAIAPFEEKISNLQSEVSSVVAAEQDRKANAQRIVLSLELANLKRAVDSGEGYSEELAEVREASTGVLDLAALESYENADIATVSELQSSFQQVADDILSATPVPKDGSLLDQLLAGARSAVQIRKINYDANDQSAGAIVARIDKALTGGRLGDVLAELDKLPEPARQRAAEWRKAVEARHAVDQALAQVEGQLKASLSGTSASSDANAN